MLMHLCSIKPTTKPFDKLNQTTTISFGLVIQSFYNIITVFAIATVYDSSAGYVTSSLPPITSSCEGA